MGLPSYRIFLHFESHFLNPILSVDGGGQIHFVFLAILTISLRHFVLLKMCLISNHLNFIQLNLVFDVTAALLPPLSFNLPSR